MLATTMLALTSLPATAETFPEPANDPFYQPPSGFGSLPPGTVLRSRAIMATHLGLPLPVEAWQILTRSNDTKRNAVGVVATLMVPVLPYLGPGPRPLLSYQVMTAATASRYCSRNIESPSAATIGRTGSRRTKAGGDTSR